MFVRCSKRFNDKTFAEFKPTGRRRVGRIVNFLDKENVSYTLRRRFGKGIDAACGQLRRG